MAAVLASLRSRSGCCKLFHTAPRFVNAQVIERRHRTVKFLWCCLLVFAVSLMSRSFVLVLSAFSCAYVQLCAAAPPGTESTREDLQALARNRQQHRKTVDGRLCAAAFIQDRQAYTGCTEVVRLAGSNIIFGVLPCVPALLVTHSKYLLSTHLSTLCISA